MLYLEINWVSKLIENQIESVFRKIINFNNETWDVSMLMFNFSKIKLLKLIYFFFLLI